MNPRMTISIDSTLAALIKANERITELEKVQAEYVTLVRKYEELILRHADLVKELATRVRLNDPVVEALVEALRRSVKWTTRIHLRRDDLPPLFLDNANLKPLIEATREALAAYNARLKEITQ